MQEQRHYLNTAEGSVGIHTRRGDGTSDTRYWHKDHLGSVVAITDASGTLKQRMRYDPWGGRVAAAYFSFGAGAYWGGTIGGSAAAGFAVGGIQGGNLQTAVYEAVTGAVTAGVFAGIDAGLAGMQPIQPYQRRQPRRRASHTRRLHTTAGNYCAKPRPYGGWDPPYDSRRDSNFPCIR